MGIEHCRDQQIEDAAESAHWLMMALALERSGFGVQSGAEYRQQKQRQDIVQRHNDAAQGLIEMKGIGEYQRNDGVVHLPEGTD